MPTLDDLKYFVDGHLKPGRRPGWDVPEDHHRHTAPYQKHSRTSRDAAKAIEPDLNRLEQEVLDFIRKQGVRGATDEEVQRGLDMNPSTQRPRRVDLVKYGLVVAAEMKRRTTRGRKAQVWRARVG